MNGPILRIVGVPLGNPADLSARAVEALRSVDLLFCEDRRNAARLYRAHDLAFPQDAWFALNEHTTPEELQYYVSEARKVDSAVLISDAGMPVLSDPGAELIALWRAAGLRLSVLPGATAATTALALSGFGNDGYHFLGFAPRDSPGRIEFLRGLLQYSLPCVLYETPYRLKALLADLPKALPARTEVFLAVNLTLPDEFSVHLRVADLAKLSDTIPKGPPVLIVCPDAGQHRKKA